MTKTIPGARPDLDAVTSAIAVLEAHFTALNARDEEALSATLHFPHYRLSGHRVKIWEGPGSYFADFRARATDDWDHSDLESCNVVAASADKVHLDIQFARCRADGRRPSKLTGGPMSGIAPSSAR